MRPQFRGGAARGGSRVCMQFQFQLPVVAARRFSIALAVAVASLCLLRASPARADCTQTLTTVTCAPPGTNGFDAGAQDDLNVTVVSGATVVDNGAQGILINNISTVTNNGTISVINNGSAGIVAIGNNNIISNAGTIGGDATVDLATGIVVGDGVSGSATIINGASASIALDGADAVGIFVQSGATAHIGNFGLIQANGDSGSGLFIDGIATVANSGTIVANGAGGTAVFVCSCGNLALINSGLVQANGDFGIGVLVSGGATGTVINSGVIQANGDTGVGIQVDFGATATVINSGLVQANGANGVGVQVDGGSTVINTGIIQGAGVGIVAASGAVTNSGTIIGGLGVVLGFGATLVNSGTIVGTDGIAIFSAIGGNALIFQPGSRVIGQILVAPGDAVTVQSGRDISSLLTFCVCGGVSFNVTGGAPFAINGTQIAVLDPTAISLADRSLTDFTGMLSSLITGRFNGTGAARTPANAASAFAPSLGGIAEVAEPAFAGIAGLAYARDNGTSSIPAATFEDRHSGISVWSQGFVGGRRQQADGPTLPATTVAYGGVLGLDKKVGRDLRVGVFVGAGQGKLEVDLNSQTVETDYVFAGLYGRIYQNTQFIDFIVTGGTTDNDSRRLVAHNLAPGGLETATASYRGWFVSPEIAYGIHIPLAPNATMTPGARLRYAVGHASGYSETGSAQDLMVGARTFHNLEARLEMALARYDEITARGWLKTTVTLGGLAMQRLGGQTVNTVLIGQSLVFSAPGDDTVGGAYMGWGLDYLTPHGFGLFVAAEGSAMTDHSIFGTARGGVRVYF
jgi:hypothetical protein